MQLLSKLDIDIDNIRPGGAPLVLEGQYASITIIINSEAELGILENCIEETDFYAC
jgi:hypothetical protein